jgi:hypothetical protein
MRTVWTVLDENDGYPIVQVFSNEKAATVEARKIAEHRLAIGRTPSVKLQRQVVQTGKEQK